ncbi:hypothetical protein V8G54_032895 [Vigna mungo]|uniref:MULE transposase domain-containing protein n=1 Tax=Vigna mungo TaxID=3915 RepID=A0AAQ3RID0_VIGMU
MELCVFFFTWTVFIKRSGDVAFGIEIGIGDFLNSLRDEAEEDHRVHCGTRGRESRPLLTRIEERIKIMVHHSGHFVNDDNVELIFDGEIVEWSCDADLLSYFGIVALVKELGHMDIKELWYSLGGQSMHRYRLELLTDDKVDDEGDVATQVEGEGDAHEGDEDTEVYSEGKGDAQEGHAQEGHGVDAEVHQVEDGEVHHVEQPEVHEVDYFEVKDLGEDDEEEDSEGEDVHEQESEEEELHDEEVHVSDESLIDVSVHCEVDIRTSKGNVREEHSSPLLESSQSTENEKNMHDIRGLSDDEWLSEELISGSESEEDDGSNKAYKWEVGTYFVEKNEFTDVIWTYALSNGRNLKFIKNDKKRISVKCMGGKGKCKWYAYCAFRSDVNAWQLRKVFDTHSCSRDFNVKLMTSKWLSQRMEKTVRENLTMKVMDIRDKVNRKWNARAMAKDNVEGSFNEKFRRLYDYGHELLKTNPGTTVQIKVDNINGEVIFQRFYACLKALKDSFVCCRPIIGLDGCFLKGKYGGELLTAVGRDGNEQMLSIAYAVVEVENKDNWTWFLELLIEDLGGKDVCAGITFISDQQKAFNSVLVNSRSKPIISVLEDIRVYIMKIWAANRTKMTSYQALVCPKVWNRFQKESWLAMKFLNINAEDYIAHWFRKSTYEETYNTIINPINGQHLWEVTPYSDILPPKKKTMPGRPKKKRRLEEWELKKNDSELRKGGQSKRCAICKELGHNKKGCPQRPTTQSVAAQTEVTQAPPTDVPIT